MSRLKTILILVVILLSIVASSPVSAEEEPTYTFSMTILDVYNNSVCNEKVMIRERGENESLVLFVDYTNCLGNVSFALENGSYWIEVRNIWVPLDIENDTVFEFPYRIIPEDGPEPDDTDDSDNKWAFVCLAIFIILLAFVAAILIRKRKPQ